MSDWVRDGHRVALEVYADGISAHLLCPGEEMCKSRITCERCSGVGESVNGPFDDGGPTYREVRCDKCQGTGHERENGHDLCHLTQWAEATSMLEYHDGNARIDGVTFPAEIRWRYSYENEGPEWRYANAVYEDEV